MVWTSEYEPVEVGGATLPDLVFEADEPALVDGSSGSAVTYTELRERIDVAARVLAARGFGRGDVLGLWGPNSPQWAELALGAMIAGGSVTPAPPSATDRELQAQLDDAGASLLVTVPAAGEPRIEAWPGTGGDSMPALIPYSSGTTGLPKGVVLTHRNLVTAVRQVHRGLRLTDRDVLLAVVPFCHVMGFMLKLAAGLCAGAKIVTMPRFELASFLGLLERYRVTVLVGPPPIAAALAEHPLVDRHDLSSLELIVSGGAPLPAGVQRALAERFPRAAVGQGWGMTETTVGGTMPDRERGTVPGSVGRVMPNTELRVVDPATGTDLSVGERGELWVRGPQVMAGYLNRPDATAEILDPDGWLRTGDLGYVDADGNVFVVDRLKELIKVNAYQVAPAELEGLLMSHPAVADAAVIARPDARRGEVPVAVVAAREAVDAADIMEWVAERVSPYKRIEAVRFVDAIPRTPSGKVLRRLLATPRRGASAPPRATGAS